MAKKTDVGLLCLEVCFGLTHGCYTVPAARVVEARVNQGKRVDLSLERLSPQKSTLFFGYIRTFMANCRKLFVIQVLNFGSLLVMVAFDQWTAQCSDNFKAFPWVGVLAHDVSDAGRVGYALHLHVLQDGLKGFEIAVDVSVDPEFHVDRDSKLNRRFFKNYG
jgi:hypothetical protein